MYRMSHDIHIRCYKRNSHFSALLSLFHSLLFSFTEFHGLDNEVMIKVLQTLGASKKAELFDDNQGVKFF